MATDERSTSLTVGVVITREQIDHPWQDHRWRPSEILIGKPDLVVGAMITGDAAQATFYAGPFEIELHRKETSGYMVNLENVPPVIYVVMREPDENDDDEASPGDLPIHVHAVTVSPFEAQDFLDSGDDIVEPLALSPPLLAWLERFVAEHHEEETFIKRKRDRLDIRNEKFGQESLEDVRKRKRQP